jgi:hypothetical protein
MSRVPSGSLRRSDRFRRIADPRPKGLRKKNWSQFASRGPHVCQLLFARPLPLRASFNKKRTGIHPSPEKRVPVLCEPSRRLIDPGTTQVGRYRIDHSHAGFPQGSLTRRFSTYLVSYWLTNAIDRIVKETPLHRTGMAPEIPARFRTTCLGLVSLLFHRRHRPVQYRIEAACPGRQLTLVISEAKVILTRKSPRSTPHTGIFCEKR